MTVRSRFVVVRENGKVGLAPHTKVKAMMPREAVSKNNNVLRMALVNLAKSLSSNLQTTLTQTSAKLTNLTNITDELDKG